MSSELTVERLVDAAPEAVFDSFVDENAQKELYAGAPDWVVKSECDLRVGGRWRISFGPPGQAPAVELNVFEEIDRPHRLVYRSTMTLRDGASFDTTIEVSFAAEGAQTRVRIRQSGFPTAELRDGFENGWGSIVARLERIVRPKPPAFAAWQHRGARDGFEVVSVHLASDGYRLEGTTAAVEAGEAWVVEYAIVLDPAWRTRSARVRACSARGRHEVLLEADGRGSWLIDGAPAPHLDGCLDVDLESSACTNTLPVHRLGLEMDEGTEAPAAYVRAPHLGIERLEQRYTRVRGDAEHERYSYSAPRFGFEAQLVYDAHGLVLDYPGIAVRAA